MMDILCICLFLNNLSNNNVFPLFLFSVFIFCSEPQLFWPVVATCCSSYCRPCSPLWTRTSHALTSSARTSWPSNSWSCAPGRASHAHTQTYRGLRERLMLWPPDGTIWQYNSLIGGSQTQGLLGPLDLFLCLVFILLDDTSLRIGGKFYLSCTPSYIHLYN